MAWNARPNYGSREGRGGYSREREEDRKPQRFPNSGAIFPVREKRSDNSPDMTGNILIADDVLDYILRESENGNEVQLDLSAWVRISRNNTSFTSIKIAIPWSVRQQEQGNQTYRQPRPLYQRQQREPERREEPPRRREAADNPYERQSAGTRRPVKDDRQTITEEFAKGDRMPNFLDDDDDDKPWE